MRLFSRDCAGTGKSGGTCCAAGMFGGGRLPFPSEPGKGTGLFVGAHRLRAVTGARTFPFQSRRGGAQGPGKAACRRVDGMKAGAWLPGAAVRDALLWSVAGRMRCIMGMRAHFQETDRAFFRAGGACHADASAGAAGLLQRRRHGEGKAASGNGRVRKSPHAAIDARAGSGATSGLRRTRTR